MRRSDAGHDLKEVASCVEVVRRHGIKGKDFGSQIKAKADSFIDSLGGHGINLKSYAVSLSLAQDIMMSAVSGSHYRILVGS